MIWLSRHPENHLLAMFTAYFDASGDDSSVALAVAGAVSDVKKWMRFENSWSVILQREGIRVFHMTDFASSRGEFKTWKGQTERRRKFLTDLLLCGRHVNKAFGVVVIASGYRTANGIFEVEEHAGRPYALAGHQCVKMVKKWQRNHPSVKELAIAFESGDLHQGKLRQLCLSHERIDPNFLGKKERKAIPFQLADLIGWRTRIGFTEAGYMDLTFERSEELQATFDDIWKRFPHEAAYADYYWLERMCIRRRIPRRK